MLDVLAIGAAALVLVYACFVAWPLSEMGQAGRPVLSAFAAALMLSTAGTLWVLVRGLDDWLWVTLIPPATMLAVMVFDRSVLWGNFPPASRGQRALQRVMAVAIFAVPAGLGWAGSLGS